MQLPGTAEECGPLLELGWLSRQHPSKSRPRRSEIDAAQPTGLELYASVRAHAFEMSEWASRIVPSPEVARDCYESSAGSSISSRTRMGRARLLPLTDPAEG